jgi:hypothetical protein
LVDIEGESTAKDRLQHQFTTMSPTAPTDSVTWH